MKFYSKLFMEIIYTIFILCANADIIKFITIVLSFNMH